MPMQEFNYLDYMAPVVVALIFALILFVLCFFIINWYCITKKDDLTVFETFGRRWNIKLGVHTNEQINRGGYASSLGIPCNETSESKGLIITQGN
uniref:Movement protein n=1 Tax=Rhabditophanes sp. KR3021 TaxID=114890 RepID=A0AC35TT66_9BILA